MSGALHLALPVLKHIRAVAAGVSRRRSLSCAGARRPDRAINSAVVTAACLCEPPDPAFELGKGGAEVLAAHVGRQTIRAARLACGDGIVSAPQCVQERHVARIFLLDRPDCHVRQPSSERMEHGLAKQEGAGHGGNKPGAREKKASRVWGNGWDHPERFGISSSLRAAKRFAVPRKLRIFRPSFPRVFRISCVMISLL